MQSGGVTIESYVRQDEKSDFPQNPTSSLYHPTTQKKPLIIGKKKNEADFIIEKRSAVSPKHLMVTFIQESSLMGDSPLILIEKQKEVECLYILVSNLGMNSTFYNYEPQENKNEIVKMTSNESIVFRISEANGVIFYLGSKRLVRVHIKKAVQGHQVLKSQEEDKQIYFEEYVCGCGINFKNVKCCFCGKLFLCESCFIFQRKSVLVKRKIEHWDEYEIKCPSSHPEAVLNYKALQDNYEVTQDQKVIIKKMDLIPQAQV